VVAVVVAVASGEDHDVFGDAVYTSHSLAHPYSTNGMDVPHWDYFGDTVISDRYIRLTPDRQSKRGQLWNTEPWSPVTDLGKNADSAPFEVHMRFHVHGQGKLGADGLGLWLTRSKGGSGSVFGNPDKFIGLGVLFDTYSNMNQGHMQYISVILGDGSQEYDHERDGGDAKLAGCEYNFRGDVHDMRIVYDNFLLRMYIAPEHEPWEECFVVRKVRIPKGYYFGLTAATGDLADNHDIISFRVIDPQPMTQQEKEELEQRIMTDIDAGVESLEHHDPQYDGAGVSRQEEHDLPMWVTVSAIGIVVVLALIVFFVTNKQQNKKKLSTF